MHEELYSDADNFYNFFRIIVFKNYITMKMNGDSPVAANYSQYVSLADWLSPSTKVFSYLQSLRRAGAIQSAQDTLSQ